MITPDAMPRDPQGLRTKAEHFRQMTSHIVDPRTVAALHELADRYAALAAELETHAPSAPGPEAPGC